MQVGYMGGMFMIYVSPSNQGKSTVLYSHACDCITQRRRTNLVTNERTPRYTLDRILRGLSGLTEEEIATRKGNTTERDEILHGWLKYCSEYLRIDDAGRYTQPWIKRLVSWDNPDVLIIDYLYAEPSNPKPAADMAVFLNDIANEKDICVITAGQLSDDNAKQFIRNDNHKTMALYGTSVPFQKSTHYYGIKRYCEYPPAAYIHCWKSTFTNKVDFSRLLPFSEDRFIFDLRAQANHHQI